MVRKKTDNKNNKKNQTIDITIEQIEKNFGKGSVMRMGENPIVDSNIKSIPTGSMGLDIALGVGGLPRGRIVEIFGAESAGKSTLAQSWVSWGDPPKICKNLGYQRSWVAQDPTLAPVCQRAVGTIERWKCKTSPPGRRLR